MLELSITMTFPSLLHLEHSQTSTMERFIKRLHCRCSTEFTRLQAQRKITIHFPALILSHVNNIIFKKETRTQDQSKSPVFPVASPQPLYYFSFSLNYTVPMAIFLSKRTKVESHRIILESSPNLIKHKNFMAPLLRIRFSCVKTAAYEETVYFLPLSAQKTMALI